MLVGCIQPLFPMASRIFCGLARSGTVIALNGEADFNETILHTLFYGKSIRH
jgi:hypothetical protein